MDRVFGRSTRYIVFHVYTTLLASAADQKLYTALMATDLGFRRALLQMATLQNTIELETAVLVDRRRECVQHEGCPQL